MCSCTSYTGSCPAQDLALSCIAHTTDQNEIVPIIRVFQVDVFVLSDAIIKRTVTVMNKTLWSSIAV